MFGGEASEKPVKVLSGGERSRLAMIKLLLEPVNLLILDEPTNHLDMNSKDVLKKAIQAFDGTVILVSHDRDFLDGLVTKVYEFGQGKVREHLGGIYDYLQKRQIDSLQALEKKEVMTPTAREKNTASVPTSAPTSGAPLSFEQQKELKKQRSAIERQVKQAEKDIADLENHIAELEAKMATPKGSQDASLYKDHASLKQKLDETTELWMELSEQMESL